MRAIIIAVLLLCFGCNSGGNIISDAEWRAIRERNEEREKQREYERFVDSMRGRDRLLNHYYRQSLIYWQLWMDNRLSGNGKEADRYRDTFMLYKDSIQNFP